MTAMDLSAEFDLAADALEGAILLVNAAEMEPSQRSKALPAVAATLRQVIDRLREKARRLDE
jgi:hypothetical protein